MIKTTSALLGLAAAAVTPASVATGVIWILDPNVTPHLAVTWLVALLVCLSHAVVLGAPALWLLCRFGRLSLKRALAAGFLLGLLPTLTTQLLMFFRSGPSSEPSMLPQLLAAPLFTALLGAVGAWSFMKVARVRPQQSS